jgi:hypothetical protein
MRRMRIVAPCQLGLLSEGLDPDPDAGLVWAMLPEHNRETVLALLAQMIGTGIIDDDEAGEETP